MRQSEWALQDAKISIPAGAIEVRTSRNSSCRRRTFQYPQVRLRLSRISFNIELDSISIPAGAIEVLRRSGPAHHAGRISIPAGAIEVGRKISTKRALVARMSYYPYVKEQQKIVTLRYCQTGKGLTTH